MKKLNDVLCSITAKKEAYESMIERKIWKKGHGFYTHHKSLFYASIFAVYLFLAYGTMSVSSYALAAGGSNALGDFITAFGKGIAVFGGIMIAWGVWHVVGSFKDTQGGDLSTGGRYIAIGAAFVAGGAALASWIGAQINQALGTP